MAINLLKNPDERNYTPRPLMEHLMALRDMLIFGAVAWNPIMMVPMWLQGIVLPLVTFLFTKVIQLAPVPSMLFNMWYCPFPIATWLTTGSIMGIALMAINFVLSWLIWMPFFRTYDKQLVEQEAAEAEADDDDDWSF